MKRTKSDNDQRFVVRSPDAQYELPESEWLVHDGGKSLYQALLNYRAPWEQLRDTIDKVPSADWVVQSQIWREWVRRDFPAAYAQVTKDVPEDAPPGTMSQSYGRQLNGVSRADRRDADATRWKRYYELLARPIVSMSQEAATRGFDLGSVLTGQGMSGRMHFFKAMSLKDPYAVLYVVLDGASIAMRLYTAMNVIYAEMVPYSSLALTTDALVNIGALWKSIDGFTAYELMLNVNAYGRQLMLYYAQMADITNRPLISRALAPIGAGARACAACATTNVQLYQCSACATNAVGYCGTECQAQHWPVHRDVCSKENF